MGGRREGIKVINGREEGGDKGDKWEGINGREGDKGDKLEEDKGRRRRIKVINWRRE